MIKLDNITILGFGDSLTSGYPGYDPDYLSGNIRSQYGFWLIEYAKKEYVNNLIFQNRGIPGELATQMYPRLGQILSQQQYNIVIILGGSNDIGWGVPINKIYKSLERMWRLALTKNSKVVACTVPPIADHFMDIQKKQHELNEMIINGIISDDMIVVDLFTDLSSDDGLLKNEYDVGDGLHLSVEGYRKMGESIWQNGVRNWI